MSKHKCTPELIRKAVELKKKGALDKDIAACVGVNPCTFSRWLNGPKTENQRQLAQELKKAEGEYYSALEQIIFRAGLEGSWQAAAWILERKRPEVYAKRTGFIDADGKEAAPTVILGVEPKVMK